MSNVYEELYEHIKAFEARLTTKIDGWDEFVADIKKRILAQQIASYPKST
ncbi:MAG: hypothetical protein FWE40_06480 [Oscillospiraceae bacterium]|nr:hypothetical protein [Oscillospiraceae bacterium]